MIKLKNILLKEEMSPREKREMKASTRNIGFHVGYIDKDANKLIKLLNKQGLRKSAEEINKSFKKHILEFQKDINNISVQHLQERTTGFSDSGRGYQSKEAQTFSVNAVKDASKKVGKLQQNVVGQFIKDIKQNKYDAMDLVRSIKTTSLGDASFSKKEFFMSLFDLIKKRTR